MINEFSPDYSCGSTLDRSILYTSMHNTVLCSNAIVQALACHSVWLHTLLRPAASSYYSASTCCKFLLLWELAQLLPCEVGSSLIPNPLGCRWGRRRRSRYKVTESTPRGFRKRKTLSWSVPLHLPAYMVRLPLCKFFSMEYFNGSESTASWYTLHTYITLQGHTPLHVIHMDCSQPDWDGVCFV